MFTPIVPMPTLPRSFLKELRPISVKRADFNIGLANPVYNLCRCTVLEQKRMAVG